MVRDYWDFILPMLSAILLMYAWSKCFTAVHGILWVILVRVGFYVSLTDIGEKCHFKHVQIDLGCNIHVVLIVQLLLRTERFPTCVLGDMFVYKLQLRESERKAWALNMVNCISFTVFQGRPTAVRWDCTVPFVKFSHYSTSLKLFFHLQDNKR